MLAADICLSPLCFSTAAPGRAHGAKMLLPTTWLVLLKYLLLWYREQIWIHRSWPTQADRGRPGAARSLPHSETMDRVPEDLCCSGYVWGTNWQWRDSIFFKTCKFLQGSLTKDNVLFLRPALSAHIHRAIVTSACVCLSLL